MYQTLEFSRLLTLVPFATEFQLERAIVDVALANELQVQLKLTYLWLNITLASSKVKDFTHRH